MTTNRWKRVTKQFHCPVCGKPDWCGISPDGKTVHCERVVSDRPAKNSGWLHPFDPNQVPKDLPERIKPRPRAELALMAKQFETAVNPEKLDRLAVNLGVSATSLKLLRIGWCAENMAWSFPMTDPTGAVMGIRLRKADGTKFAVRGCRQGLFVPANFTSGRALIAEGPTDTAALIDLGFNTIGRPSCSGAVEMIQAMLKPPRRDVVIFCNIDEPDTNGRLAGQEGATALAKAIHHLTKSLKIVGPPFVKDARAWKQVGATHEVVESVIVRARYFVANRIVEGVV